MARLRVAMGELKLNIRQSEHGQAIPVRFVISNVTGVVLNVHAYKEVKNERRQDIFVSGTAPSILFLFS
jgi:predicted transposase YbfD/YdcC